MIEPAPSAEEANEWLKIAERIAKNQTRNMSESLGFDALAADAIEKLLKQKARPDNIPAWLKTVISNDLKDKYDKKKGRPRRESNSVEEVNELVNEYFDRLPRSLGTPMVRRDEVRRLLEELSDKDRQTIALIANGWSSQEVADQMGFASAKVVANRIKIIRKKMTDAFGDDGKYFLQNM